MITLEAALAAYAGAVTPLAPARTGLKDALLHVLAAEVRSCIELPTFTQSAVDGYALASSNVRAASAAAPVRLPVAGEIAAGAPAPRALQPGTALRIFTGGALPDGADAAARQEIVAREGDTIVLRAPVPAGADVRVRGEELQAGEPLAAPGARLTPELLAALAMAGNADFEVRPRPRVALVVTGDEVAQAGTATAPGQVVDANGPLVAGWLRRRLLPLVSTAFVRDDPLALRTALAHAAREADLVVTTGGVSVGDRDYVPEVAGALGFERVFWKVAQKPGKPMWFGRRGATCLLGLPGNPAAVLIGLHVHAARILELMEGVPDPGPHFQTGFLPAPLGIDAQRDRLVRVAVRRDGDGRAQLTMLPRQESHMLSNLGQAMGLAWIPAGAAPTQVRWLELR